MMDGEGVDGLQRSPSTPPGRCAHPPPHPIIIIIIIIIIIKIIVVVAKYAPLAGAHAQQHADQGRVVLVAEVPVEVRHREAGQLPGETKAEQEACVVVRGRLGLVVDDPRPAEVRDVLVDPQRRRLWVLSSERARVGEWVGGRANARDR